LTRGLRGEERRDRTERQGRHQRKALTGVGARGPRGIDRQGWRDLFVTPVSCNKPGGKGGCLLGLTGTLRWTGLLLVIT
jgi:hypothetical protein